MCQRKYALDLLSFSNLTDCKPSITLIAKPRVAIYTNPSSSLQDTGT